VLSDFISTETSLIQSAHFFPTFFVTNCTNFALYLKVIPFGSYYMWLASLTSRHSRVTLHSSEQEPYTKIPQDLAFICAISIVNKGDSDMVKKLNKKSRNTIFKSINHTCTLSLSLTHTHTHTLSLSLSLSLSGTSLALKLLLIWNTEHKAVNIVTNMAAKVHPLHISVIQSGV